MTPQELRLKELQSRLPEFGCEALLLEDETSLLYLTGMHFSAGELIVFPTSSALIVDGRYAESAQTSTFHSVHLAGDEVLPRLLKKQQIQKLGFSEEMSYGNFLALQKKLPGTALLPLPTPLAKQRMIKDTEERRLMHQAAHLGSLGFDYVCSQIKEGVTECELAAALEIFWLQQGGQGLAFRPIIAFEPRNSRPHYQPQAIPLERGQSVLIDIGVKVQDYHSDMTRVVFFGEPHPKLCEIYEIVKQAQEMALSLCRPGTQIGELDAAARDLITAAGYGEAFPHSLGHGIGLEIHEAPRVRNKEPDKEVVLQPHMAITIEPGIYLPNIGGVRIEDTVMITATGYENLTLRSRDLCILPAS